MTDEVELCRRCHTREGTERTYYPGQSFSLAGVQTKFSVKRTVSCDECWEPFVAYIEGLQAGTVEPDPSYHA